MAFRDVMKAKTHVWEKFEEAVGEDYRSLCFVICGGDLHFRATLEKAQIKSAKV